MIELPDFAQPKAVSRAAALVREREADVAAAKEAVDEAKKNISAAIVDARTLLADALDAGRDDPGTPREHEARGALSEAERRLAAEETRRERARVALDEALTAQIEGWESKLVQDVECTTQRLPRWARHDSNVRPTDYESAALTS